MASCYASFWCLYAELRSNDGNELQNNKGVSVLTVRPNLTRLPWVFPLAPMEVNGTPRNIQGNLTRMRHDSAYIILFITRYDEPIHDDNAYDPHIDSVSHSSVYILVMTSQSIARCIMGSGSYACTHVKGDIELVIYRVNSR